MEMVELSVNSDNNVGDKKAGSVVDGTLPEKDVLIKTNVEEASESQTNPAEHMSATSMSKLLWGVMIIFGIAVSWVGATQFAKEAYSPEFNGPFFLIWFATCWMLVCFPVSVITTQLSPILWRKHGSYESARIGDDSCKIQERWTLRLAMTISTSFKIYGENGITAVTFCTRVLLFCIMWLLTNYLYLKALTYMRSSDLTALFVFNTAFVYILSIICLSEKFNLLRLTSVAFSISGVVMITYIQAEHNFKFSNNIGVVFALVSAFVAALYQVLFKKIIGNSSDFNQVALFLTMIGVCNILLMWPIMLLFFYTDMDQFEWHNLPWIFLTGSAALQLLFNFLINFGVAFTFPLFIAVGTLVGIPLNTVIDVVWRQESFEFLTGLGMALICMGFCLMLMPDTWNNQVMKVFPML